MPPPPPPRPPPQTREDNPDSDSGFGSSEATVSDEVQAVAAGADVGEGISQSQELVWGEMQEAWFNAIAAGGFGPGSPVWDDLDTTNNLLLQSQLPFGNQNSQAARELRLNILLIIILSYEALLLEGSRLKGWRV
jgi:hypothetical protein